jgi:hypothetical protein
MNGLQARPKIPNSDVIALKYGAHLICGILIYEIYAWQ